MQDPRISNNFKSLLSGYIQHDEKAEVVHVSDSDNCQTNLIINYLPIDMEEDELLSIFGQIGQVVKYKIIRNKQSGESLGYGFVEFKDATSASIAKTMCDRRVIRGKSLKVAFARPRSDDIVNANLYVAHLPLEMDETQLSALFQCYGSLIEVKILRCKLSGRSRGVGFVRFDQRISAQVALATLNQHILPGTTKPIMVEWAHPPTMYKPSSSKTEGFCCRRHNRTTNAEPRNPNLAKRQMEPMIQQTAKRICPNNYIHSA